MWYHSFVPLLITTFQFCLTMVIFDHILQVLMTLSYMLFSISFNIYMMVWSPMRDYMDMLVYLLSYFTFICSIQYRWLVYFGSNSDFSDMYCGRVTTFTLFVMIPCTVIFWSNLLWDVAFLELESVGPLTLHFYFTTLIPLPYPIWLGEISWLGTPFWYHVMCC